MPDMKGQAKKTLIEKLGIKEGFKIAILNPPQNYYDTLGQLPKGIFVKETLDGSLDFLHFFAKEKVMLELIFPALKKGLSETGMLWVSWPKASSSIDTNLNEDIVREIGLANNLIDVKLCSIDEKWSGLKFVFRLENRKKV
jgi:hypothetical protein